MKSEIAEYLENDLALMAVLTGGLHEGTQVSRQDTPEAFDANGEILPCALVKDGMDSQAGPHEDAARVMVELYFYERAGYENISQAMRRVYELLHRQNAWILGVWEIRHTDSVRETRDDALGCSLGMSRYEVWVNKATKW